jgi:hypothetical protein
MPNRRSFCAGLAALFVLSAMGQSPDNRPKKRVGTVGEIRYTGLPDDLERRAKEAMPLKVGGEYSGATLNAANAAMKQLDSHLRVLPVDSSTDSGKWVVTVEVSLRPNE